LKGASAINRQPGVVHTLSWTVIGDGLPRFLTLGLTLYVGRRLGAGSFALYSLAFAWTQLAWAGVDLGTSSYAVRTIAGRPPRPLETLFEILGLNTLLALSIMCVATLITVLLVHDPVLKATTLAMLLFLPTFALYPDWFLRGSGKLPLLGAANFAVAGTWAAGILVFGAQHGPPGFGLAWALSPLGGVLVFWAMARPSTINFRAMISPSRWVTHLRISVLYAIAGLLGNGSTPVALTFLRDVTTKSALGSYALGLQISAAVGAGLWLLLLNLMPRLMREHSWRTQKVAIGGALALGTVGAGSALILSSSVLRPIVGVSYFGGGIWLAAGLLTICPRSARGIVEALLVAKSQNRARVMMGMSAIALSVLGGLGALFAHQPAIVAVAYVVGELSAVAVGFLALRRTGLAFS